MRKAVLPELLALVIVGRAAPRQSRSLHCLLYWRKVMQGTVFICVLRHHSTLEATNTVDRGLPRMAK